MASSVKGTALLRSMTEQQWLSCTDPDQMLTFLRRNHLLDDRRARLFAVACANEVRHLMEDARSHRALEVAERYADGGATAEERAAARAAAWSAAWSAAWDAAWVAWDAAGDAAWDAAWDAAGDAAWVAWDAAGDAAWVAWVAMRRKQCDLLRNIFGNPFRQLQPHAHGWEWLRQWNDGVVHKIAQHVYNEKDWAMLPLLADALEDAGCADEAALAACRSGSGVRGHWVVDLLLGKE